MKSKKHPGSFSNGERSTKCLKNHKPTLLKSKFCKFSVVKLTMTNIDVFDADPNISSYDYDPDSDGSNSRTIAQNKKNYVRNMDELTTKIEEIILFEKF